jgi:8-oxo-dGTP diphosphatase
VIVTVHTTQPSDFQLALEVAGCFLQWEDRLLYLKRSPTSPQGGTWCIPGGKLEKGETPRMAVIREIREEVGLHIDSPELILCGPLWMRRSGNHRLDYAFHIFKIVLKEKPTLALDLTEHTEARWVDSTSALKLPLIPGGQEALAFFTTS